MYHAASAAPPGPWQAPVALKTINTPDFAMSATQPCRATGSCCSSPAIAPAASAGSTSIYPDGPTETMTRGGRRRRTSGRPSTVRVADVGPAYVEDEAGSTVLYFTSQRPAPAGFGAADIYKSTLGADGSFGPPVLVRELSSQR